jgi:hypothetical protein
MGVYGEISEQTRNRLELPITGQVHFSDVFPEVDGSTEWWRKTDFDAGLTVGVESSGFPTMEQIPIGFRPWLANYGLVLVDDLVQARNERNLQDPQKEKSTHPDINAERREAAGAIIALANYAPRDEEHTADGANGSDFYLAITDSGLEIYTTPLSFLKGLDARHRITALYRIPTKGHPEFNGEHEQFRSARVVRTRRHPEHLVSIFEYEDREAIIAAKQKGAHAQVIPVEDRPGSFAFVDKFGNTKLELHDVESLATLEIGRTVKLLVRNKGRKFEIPVHVAEDLHSAPLGKLAIYANCSDQHDKDSSTGFVELISRVEGNPSTSRKTAIFQLLKIIPKLDLHKAHVRLKT